MLFFADVVVMPLTLCWHSYDNLCVLLYYDGPVFMGFLFMVEYQLILMECIACLKKASIDVCSRKKRLKTTFKIGSAAAAKVD